MLKLYNKKTNVHKLRNRATISLIRKCSIQIDVSIQSTDITFILSYIKKKIGGGAGGIVNERVLKSDQNCHYFHLWKMNTALKLFLSKKILQIRKG